MAMTVLGTSQPLRVMRSGQGRTIIGQRCNRMCVLGISNGKSAQTYPGNSTFKKCQNSNIQTDVSNFTISFFVMLDTKCSPYISFEHLNSKFWHLKNKPLLTLDFGRFPPLKLTEMPKPKPLGILLRPKSDFWVLIPSHVSATRLKLPAKSDVLFLLNRSLETVVQKRIELNFPH